MSFRIGGRVSTQSSGGGRSLETARRELVRLMTSDEPGDRESKKLALYDTVAGDKPLDQNDSIVIYGLAPESDGQPNRFAGTIRMSTIHGKREYYNHLEWRDETFSHNYARREDGSKRPVYTDLEGRTVPSVEVQRATEVWRPEYEKYALSAAEENVLKLVLVVYENQSRIDEAIVAAQKRSTTEEIVRVLVNAIDGSDGIHLRVRLSARASAPIADRIAFAMRVASESYALSGACMRLCDDFMRHVLENNEMYIEWRDEYTTDTFRSNLRIFMTNLCYIFDVEGSEKRKDEYWKMVSRLYFRGDIVELATLVRSLRPRMEALRKFAEYLLDFAERDGGWAKMEEAERSKLIYAFLGVEHMLIALNQLRDRDKGTARRIAALFSEFGHGVLRGLSHRYIMGLIEAIGRESREGQRLEEELSHLVNFKSELDLADFSPNVIALALSRIESWKEFDRAVDNWIWSTRRKDRSAVEPVVLKPLTTAVLKLKMELFLSSEQRNDLFDLMKWKQDEPDSSRSVTLSVPDIDYDN